MSPRTLHLDERVADYLRTVGGREHAVLARLRAETAPLPRSGMQLSAEQGQLLALLVELIGARRCIEVGTFTGYSALSIALALPDDGHADALDISEEYMAKARGYWKAAGQERKITGHVAPALDTLKRFLAEGRGGTYDFAFIDADKTSYDAYYEHMLQLVRPGGLVAIDNVLWSGRVCDPSDMSPDTQALRALNAKIKNDNRVDTVLLPITDGIFMCRKR